MAPHRTTPDGDAKPRPGATHLYSGKARDLYTLPDGTLVMVASDRISAYDFVLEPGIPDKGVVLTQLSLWWFEQLTDLAPHHVLSTDVDPSVAGRAVVCERLEMVPVECIVRGYLTGGGLDEYERHGTVSGISLPPGLVDGARLPEPIFTPTTKAPVGEHDRPMTYAEVEELIGAEAAAEVRELTLAVYTRAERVARERGVIVADTKIELGRRPDGTLVLADEILTPDSSRFWPADEWEPGHRQPSFDKQYVRDWLARESGWDKDSGTAPPPLPPEVVERTRARYVEAYEKMTGRTFGA